MSTPFRHTDDYGTHLYVTRNPDDTLVVTIDNGDIAHGIVYNVPGADFAAWLNGE